MLLFQYIEFQMVYRAVISKMEGIPHSYNQGSEFRTKMHSDFFQPYQDNTNKHNVIQEF